MTCKSSKQTMMANSTCKLEYIVASEASKDAAWLKNFIGDLEVVPTIQEPMELFCYNKGEADFTKETKDHRRSKHIDKKYHHITHKVDDGHLLVKQGS